jgi:D-glycero-alpha-D-manno-heptose-7-phosphate kinase
LIITRTPHRISLAGGGSDLPAHYRAHGGATLGFALAQYCWISLRRLPPYFAHRHRIVWSRTELVREVDEIAHPAAREVLRAVGAPGQGYELHHAGDIPHMSGMGSSSAFTVGLLNAAATLDGRRLSPEELASDAIHVEQALIGEAVGSQDQVFAAFGGFNRLQFGATPEEIEAGFKPNIIGIHPLEISPSRKVEILAHLMLVYTGTTRVAAEVEAVKIARINENARGLAALAAMVNDAEAILTDPRCPVTELGALLDAAWRVKRGLAPGVAPAAVDALYGRARAAGAVGGKLLGAGGGGFFLLVVEPERRAAVKVALGDPIEVPVAVDRAGSTVVVDQPNGWK